jgi:multidrug efflux pump
MYVVLEEFHHRHSPKLYADEIANQLRRELYTRVQDAQTAVFGAPPIDGLGNAGGFKLMIEDRGSNGLEQLQEEVDDIVEKGNETQGLAGLFTMFRADTPQLYIDIDRVKCKTMGVPLSEVFTALQTYLGGYYVNDFNEFDRTWQVNLQAETDFRIRPATARQLKVRNLRGEMVPLGAIAKFKDSSGPQMINRYNMYPAAPINGAWSPGTSSGQAVAAMQQLCGQELSPSMGYEWTELTYQEIMAGNTALFIFPLCILFVFLTHSAEYESWSLPLAIILIVPMSLMCALGGAALRGMDNNIFTQIGFVVLAGLACKNAVLIVEFAKQQREQGASRWDAAVEATRLRLRPIMMTSFAFILGVVPLAVAKGAGAEMRQTLGTSVFFGMLGVTFFGLFLTPVFYYVLQGVSEYFSPHVAHAAASNSDQHKTDPGGSS